MRLPVLCLPLLLLALPSCAQEGPVRLSPEQIGQIFCIARQGNDEAPIRALLSPSVAADVARAEARSAALGERFPDEKPPLGDGLPWQSFPDVPATCTVTGATTESKAADGEFVLVYGFPDAPDAGWTDRIVLVDIDGRLRISDIVYEDGSTLGQFLLKASQP